MQKVWQVDPRYESRLGAIRKRWQKLHKDTGNLTARDKKRALGDEMWGPNMLAKVNYLRHAWREYHVKRSQGSCQDAQMHMTTDS